jgi:hypothetical protein
LDNIHCQCFIYIRSYKPDTLNTKEEQ